MTKLLIADDEPLVQIGLKSMLNWADYDIEICATAMNGAQALELIERHSPEIVITDIKMPVMNGLELARTCRERFGKLPLFIILTSYEEFQLVKEALSCQVLDYLVKLELNKDSLEAVIKKALQTLDELPERKPAAANSSITVFQDKFFIRLLHNLFDDEEQLKRQAKDFELDFSYPYYIACHALIQAPPAVTEQDKLFSLYTSTLQMIREILGKSLPCYVISLDLKYFGIILMLSGTEDYKQLIAEALSHTFSMVHNYFNVDVLVTAGNPCPLPILISESYQEARQIFSMLDNEHRLLFYEDVAKDAPNKNAFNMSLFKEDISKAFDEFDTETLSGIFREITELFTSYPTRYLQAIDAASNILYLAISLLPNGEETVSQIFAEFPDGYRSIYRQTTIEQVVDWLDYFGQNLCRILDERKKTYKNHIVNNVQKYISEHIEEKLNLNDIASVFNISPSYLSQLFKKYNDTGFSEYISQMKIERAKELMSEGNLKIYEIADKLGFESAFYFSKVFKKVTGLTPRDYQQLKL
ncbi:MAG: AraC family transcriptional regulator [Lachnospiraceae bacterium]|nr:AraC family transcriptional regulator [Lachnospiraceae bacterium]